MSIAHYTAGEKFKTRQTKKGPFHWQGLLCQIKARKDRGHPLGTTCPSLQSVFPYLGFLLIVNRRIIKFAQNLRFQHEEVLQPGQYGEAWFHQKKHSSPTAPFIEEMTTSQGWEGNDNMRWMSVPLKACSCEGQAITHLLIASIPNSGAQAPSQGRQTLVKSLH